MISKKTITKDNTQSTLESYLRKYETVVTQEFVECCDIPSIHYDFRKNKLTIDLLRTRTNKKTGGQKSNYDLIEFLGMSIFSVHEFENDFEDLKYKESQYLNSFMILSKNEKIEIKVSSKNNIDDLSDRCYKSVCNVFIEIEECKIFIKANKIRINEEEFILES